MLTNQLNDREAYCEIIQSEVVPLRHGLVKSNKELSQYQTLMESKRVMDEMLVKQRYPLIKVGLDFKEKPNSKIARDEGLTSQEKEA